MILIVKPNSRVIKVTDLLKRDENLSGRARVKTKNERDEPKLLQFKSRLTIVVFE